MSEVSLVAESGREVGSRSSGRLRVEGKIPAVLYGHGIEPQAIAVGARALRNALSTDAGRNALLSLKVEGKTHLALARELQLHPVRGTVIHVDFLTVRRDEVVSADVPIHLVGDASEVRKGDGVVEHHLFTLTINATPDKIPSAIEVDISGMHVGDTIRVADIRLPQGTATDADPEEPIATAPGSTTAAEVEEIQAGEPAGEAEAGESAETTAAEESEASSDESAKDA